MYSHAPAPYNKYREKREEAEMIGLEVLLVLLVTRLILPVGLLLLIGERVRRNQAQYWFR